MQFNYTGRNMKTFYCSLHILKSGNNKISSIMGNCFGNNYV